jgi:uncharacterized protein (DUF362 family)
MDRRRFLATTLGGIAAGSLLNLTERSRLLAGQTAARPYDLVAVRGGEPDAMFDRGIASLGGIGSFVPKGAKVLVKPNIGWDVTPENGANTNPLLVRRIIEHCINAGAKEVRVFDHACDNWVRTYRTSGIERAVKDAGGMIVSGDSERYYQQVSLPKGTKISDAMVHELVLESDVFINVPVLKSHSSARLTIGMKNNMGIVWDRGYWHRNDLHRCIAEFAAYRKPHLTVVDAYAVMKANGPRGISRDDVVLMKAQILATDIVAADAAAAKLFGMGPETIPYIMYAEEMRLGTKNLDALSINRIKM